MNCSLERVEKRMGVVALVMIAKQPLTNVIGVLYRPRLLDPRIFPTMNVPAHVDSHMVNDSSNVHELKENIAFSKATE